MFMHSGNSGSMTGNPHNALLRTSQDHPKLSGPVIRIRILGPSISAIHLLGLACAYLIGVVSALMDGFPWPASLDQIEFHQYCVVHSSANSTSLKANSVFVGVRIVSPTRLQRKAR